MSGVPSPGKLMLRGGGCLRSTPRQGKPATWGRGARKGVARKGNLCRTRRIGSHKPTSLRGIATQRRVSVTEASLTEEPCEGKLHAGICAGGVGRPAFLPRHRDKYVLLAAPRLLRALRSRGNSSSFSHLAAHTHHHDSASSPTRKRVLDTIRLYEVQGECNIHKRRIYIIWDVRGEKAPPFSAQTSLLNQEND